MYLDTITPAQISVGYGQMGTRGSLGYEGKQVRVQGQAYPHSLSTHPPARLLYQLGGRYGAFRCQVALNDDAAGQATRADFVVRADGRQVALLHVAAGEPPRELAADLAGAQTLELAVRTTHWPWCHAVWLDPQLEEAAAAAPARVLVDCLGRAEIALPQRLPQARRCIATVVSHGFEAMLDDMLGSLLANGGCQDALLLIFILGHSPAAEQVAAKYRALTVSCQPRSPVNAASKAILYSVAHVVDAAHYLCLDADMLVLGDLRPVFAALEACPEGSILACREGNGRGLHSVGHALTTAYGGRESDLARILGKADGEGAYSLVVNDGLFAGGRSALLALDAAIRGMPGAVAWADERRDVWWRNQLVFNLALARLDCGVELDGSYNVQLHVQEVALNDSDGRLWADWQGRPVRVLHFSGVGKRQYGRWKGVYGRVAEPLAGGGHGDGYAAFLDALRPWLARHGLPALAWSFYGTADGRRGQVNDPATFPLFALLHYLLRANGCGRVLETGTARGVSAACIASAVAHRPDGRVVTLDLADYPERASLWQALPEPLARCIEPRRGDALAGMAAALAAGERYHAALLDTLHTAEHVWAEFELARQLVCPGGLILIHDATYPHGSVEGALQRIEAAGYGVVRLWTAQEGAAEDDHLGLAVIENRPRAGTDDPQPASSDRSRPATGQTAAARAGQSASSGRSRPAARQRVSVAQPASSARQPPSPLISCIMPTRGRGDYVLQAVRYFLRQDYPARELIIVDDDTQDLTPRLPADPRIRYLRTPPGLSIGAKRNRACRLATGEIIAQWDDDDWYGPQRLSAQAAPLLAGQADITGLETGVFFELERWRFWRCTPRCTGGFSWGMYTAARCSIAGGCGSWLAAIPTARWPRTRPCCARCSGAAAGC
jgi:predicted O-methyltransferase YrrM